jgi:nucleotide-binding universal stress UspA family protein
MPAGPITRQPRIVVGVDGSPTSKAALRWAIHQAELTGSTVDAVLAWEYPAAIAGLGWAPVPVVNDAAFETLADKTLAETVSEVAGPDPASAINPVVVNGYPAAVLLHAAEGADLLVVGSRGHSEFINALLGSVSQNCAHHAKCPVLIIRPDQSASERAPAHADAE